MLAVCWILPGIHFIHFGINLYKQILRQILSSLFFYRSGKSAFREVKWLVKDFIVSYRIQMQVCLVPKLKIFAHYHNNYLLEWKVTVILQRIEIMSVEDIDKTQLIFSIWEKKDVKGGNRGICCAHQDLFCPLN